MALQVQGWRQALLIHSVCMLSCHVWWTLGDLWSIVFSLATPPNSHTHPKANPKTLCDIAADSEKLCHHTLLKSPPADSVATEKERNDAFDLIKDYFDGCLDTFLKRANVDFFESALETD